MSADERPAAPVLRIVRGDPTAEELAALVTVLASAGGEPPAPPPGARSQWAIPERMLRQPVAPSGWWASSLPR